MHKYGASEQTVYDRRSKFGGMEVFHAVRLSQLQEENRKLKRLVTGLARDSLECNVKSGDTASQKGSRQLPIGRVRG